VFSLEWLQGVRRGVRYVESELRRAGPAALGQTGVLALFFDRVLHFFFPFLGDLILLGNPLRFGVIFAHSSQFQLPFSPLAFMAKHFFICALL
jgi:hypothetical protein